MSNKRLISPTSEAEIAKIRQQIIAESKELNIEKGCQSEELNKPADESKFSKDMVFKIELHHKTIRFSKELGNYGDLHYTKVWDFLQNEAKAFGVYPLITEKDGKLGVYYKEDVTNLWKRLLVPYDSAIVLIDLITFANSANTKELVIELAFEVVINENNEKFIATPSQLTMGDYLGSENLESWAYVVNDTTIPLNKCGKRKTINFRYPNTRLVPPIKKAKTGKVILRYPIARYWDVYSEKEFDELPEKEEEIMKFYQEQVSKKDRELILKAYRNEPSGDMNEIACCFVDKKFNCPYSELMGDKKVFERLEKWEEIGENVYEVVLGSIDF
jgi:hypothetical protein